MLWQLAVAELVVALCCAAVAHKDPLGIWCMLPFVAGRAFGCIAVAERRTSAVAEEQQVAVAVEPYTVIAERKCLGWLEMPVAVEPC